jgi:hypothetical protein
MKKNFMVILLCVASLGMLSSCRKKNNTCQTEQTCNARYSYDECDACYELEAHAAEISYDEVAEDEADMTMINKF